MSDFEVTIKNISAKETYKIKVVPTTTIGELKQLIEKESTIPSAEIKLICKGKILKASDEKMADLGVNAETPVSMIRQQPQDAAASGTAGTTGGASNTSASSAAQPPNPNMFGNMGGLPGLDALGLGALGAGGLGAEQIGQAMNNPAVRQQVASLMQNPELIRNLLQNHPLGQQLSQQNPQLAQMFSDPNFASQLSGMMGMFGGVPAGGAQGGGAGNLPPINFENLLGSASFPPNPTAASTPTTPDLPPEEKYREQISKLNEMGFLNKELNIQALTQSMGNVDVAVEKLLSWFK